jgi:hypothetical protein
MIGWLMSWKLFRRKRSWLNRGAVPEFAWEWLRKSPPSPPIRITGDLVDVRAEQLPITSLGRYRYTNPLSFFWKRVCYWRQFINYVIRGYIIVTAACNRCFTENGKALEPRWQNFASDGCRYPGMRAEISRHCVQGVPLWGEVCTRAACSEDLLLCHFCLPCPYKARSSLPALLIVRIGFEINVDFLLHI